MHHHILFNFTSADGTPIIDGYLPTCVHIFSFAMIHICTCKHFFYELHLLSFTFTM